MPGAGWHQWLHAGGRLTAAPSEPTGVVLRGYWVLNATFRASICMLMRDVSLGSLSSTGSGRNSLHVALWGTVDTNSNTLEMSVGLPAETLAKAGLKGLPPGYMLPVAVSGPLHRPQVEWNAAGEAAAGAGRQFRQSLSCACVMT